MAPTPTQLEYLQADYDFKKLTIAQLCSILSNHKVALPSSRQPKGVYIDLFQTEIIEKSEELLQEIENIQPSAAGIEFVPSKLSKIPVKVQDHEKPNLMHLAKQLSADQSPNPVIEKRKEFDGSKSPEKRFKPQDPLPKRTLNVFRKPPSPMMMKSMQSVENSGIQAPRSENFSVLPTLPGIRSRIEPSSPHVIADRLKPVKEMVAKFDDGKPVKPRDLYQRFNADSDSTLSEEDEDEEFYIEDDSFFEKHPLDDESDVLVEEKVEEVLNQTEKLFEEWQFTVKSVKPADGDFTEDKITTGKKVQTESILYAFFKISIYAVTLAFLISVVAEMTHDFNFNQAKESILYGFKNPSKASELLLKSAISKYDVIKARLQSFDFVVAQKQVQGSLISMVSSIKSRLESFELSHIKDSAVLMVGSAKARVDSIDYEFISNAFENVKSKVFENFEKSATFVRGIYMVEINARAHLFWDWISSGQIYEDINHSQVSLMNSAFVSASYQYLSQAKAAMSQFSLNFLRLLQAAYYMLSASFGKALTSIAELFDHPGFDESRRWINQIYSNFHNALEKQFSWILKSAMFKSGLLKFEDMIQSDDWNFLDSTGALLIAGGTTVGFIAFVLAFV